MAVKLPPDALSGLAPLLRARRELQYLWNFVASSTERIEEAKAEWRAEKRSNGRFDLPVDDRDEHIPLPG